MPNFDIDESRTILPRMPDPGSETAKVTFQAESLTELRKQLQAVYSDHRLSFILWCISCFVAIALPLSITLGTWLTDSDWYLALTFDALGAAFLLRFGLLGLCASGSNMKMYKNKLRMLA